MVGVLLAVLASAMRTMRMDGSRSTAPSDNLTGAHQSCVRGSMISGPVAVTWRKQSGPAGSGSK
jgi:hypothetical protein